MMNGVSAKALAEAEEERGDEKDKAKRAADKLLSEKGAPLKAELEQQLHLRFMDDVSRALFVRQYGWPGAEKPLEPIKGVSPSIARTVWELAKDKRLAKFSKFWEQLSNAEDYERLKLTAGISEDDN